MSDLHNKLAQSGDHHHSHGIIHMMIEGAMIGGVAALLAHLASKGMGEMVDKWQEGHPHGLDPSTLGNVLGADKVQAIAQNAGLSIDDTLKYLSAHLPGAAKAHAGN